MKLRDLGLYLAWLVAIVATAGSLYLSEVRHFVPCTLCWYQRIMMYPLVILLGIASFRNDRGIIAYTLPMSLLGLATATYHVLEQNIPGFGAPQLCQLGIPCSVKYINWLGFISIPVMSLTAFTLISLFLILAIGRNKLPVETKLA
ncbi:MAG: disulfide bond formation protein B [Trueperaceae bacterium]|nr:disulfide bond formation protein B [Trueperaceae bacterium]